MEKAEGRILGLEVSGATVTGDLCTIVVVVRSVSDLFETTARLPARYVPLESSVLEFLAGTLSKYRSKCSRFELVLRVDSSVIAESSASFVTAASLARAIRAYFLEREKNAALRLRSHFSDALKMLVYGGAFMLACTLLRTALAPEEEHSLMSSFREGLLVIGWVALWKPIEELLFNWWPIRREQLEWRTLASMPARVEVIEGM